ncbi:hypothetical protein L6Q79_03180 [bacterium]|nr:hypothetical protein [bacterium]NUN44832.1 hypothetical protein [bacterium]
MPVNRKIFSLRFILFFSVLLSGIWLLSGCDELMDDENDDNDCDPKPSDCHETKYSYGYLNINLTINQKNDSVLIRIFRGDFDNKDILFEKFVYENTFSYQLPTEEYYSVVARYIQNDGDTVLAVDADDIENDRESYCDGDCYELDNGSIDLKLRFPKETAESVYSTRYIVRSRQKIQ